MTAYTYASIFTAFFVSYLIRVLPLTLIRKPIKNKFIKSFLYYVPYITLSVMTFPAIVDATQSPIAGIIALVAGSLVGMLMLAILKKKKTAAERDDKGNAIGLVLE